MLALVVVAALSVAAAPPAGDAARGRRLLESFECGRCHTLPPDASTFRLPPQYQCAECHQRAKRGEGAPTVALKERWSTSVKHWLDVPRLDGLARHLRRDWVVRFLQAPHDVRPALEETMPRLPLTATQAQDIARFLVVEGTPKEQKWLPGSSAAAGAVLFGEHGCGGCHVFSGSGVVGNAVGKAPDLRHARERLAPATVLRWLANPAAMEPATAMRVATFTELERQNLARFVLETPLLPTTTTTTTTTTTNALPALTRRVAWADVQPLLADCAHCHDDAIVARGNGGPGNTGGMGFTAIGLELSGYSAILRARVNGESVTASPPTGASLLVQALLRRRQEASDEAAGRVPLQDAKAPRGMPLGLPPLSLADIQLIDSWLQQGMPR